MLRASSLRGFRTAVPAWPAPASAQGRAQLLFTPGPLSTSAGVKAAAARDIGSRDPEFVACVASVRARLLALAGVPPSTHSVVLLPGSGTAGVEAVVGSFPARKRARGLLIAVNGAYGDRMAAMARRLNLPHTVLQRSERRPLDAAAVVRAATRYGPGEYSAVAVVHHETTAGVLNPVAEIGAALAATANSASPAPALIVDSMSGFGAHALDAVASRASFVVSSANKCIEGLPGFSFVIAERAALEQCQGQSHSLFLDLHAQWRGLEDGGQFRFTPPTQALLAFSAALDEHAAEGGAARRLQRYAANAALLHADLAELGFTPYVEPAAAGAVISTFLLPDDARFDFARFYTALAARGCVIYPGKLTQDSCFRVGSIGHLFPADIRRLTTAVRDVLGELGVALPVRQVAAKPDKPDVVRKWNARTMLYEEMD